MWSESETPPRSVVKGSTDFTMIPHSAVGMCCTLSWATRGAKKQYKVSQIHLFCGSLSGPISHWCWGNCILSGVCAELCYAGIWFHSIEWSMRRFIGVGYRASGQYKPFAQQWLWINIHPFCSTVRSVITLCATSIATDAQRWCSCLWTIKALCSVQLAPDILRHHCVRL